MISTPMSQRVMPLAVLFATGVCLPVHAQDTTSRASAGANAGPALEEVLVTAQKTTESLQDVPIAVTALGAEQLEQRGLSSLTSMVGASIPGVFVQKNGNPSVVRIDMRGIKTDDPQQSTMEAGVGIYLDDVYMARTGGQSISIQEIEQIEILRGPQGTLFGRNAEGGAIRYVTKDPTGELGGTVKIGAGNYGIYNREIHLNLPTFAGLAMKLDIRQNGNDEWTKNPASPTPLDEHRDYGALDVSGLAFSLLYEPNDQFRAKYVYDVAEAKSTTWNWLKGEVPSSCVNGPCNTAVAVAASRTYPDDEHVGTADMGLYNDRNESEVSGHRLQLEYKFDGGPTVKSITAYRELDDTQPGYQLGTSFSLVSFGGATSAALNRPFLPALDTNGVGSAGFTPTTPFYGATGIVGFGRVNQHQTSQEFQLLGSTDTTKWIVGLFYFREEATDERATAFSVAYTGFANGRPVNPVATNPFYLAASNYIRTYVDARAEAAFGQITWTPSALDRLHLTGGLRYSRDEKSFDRDINNGAPAQLSQPDYDDDRIDPAATVAYDLTDSSNVYLRLAQGYRAGGASVRAPWVGPLAAFATFDAEINRTAELGLKSNLLQDRLRLNIAAYVSKIKDMQQTAQLVPNNPQATSIVNMPGKTTVNGLELETVFAATDRLRLSGSVTLQDYDFASAVDDYIAQFDPGSEYFLAVPEWNFGIAADYSLPQSYGEWVLHVDHNRAEKGPLTSRVNLGGYGPEGGINLTNARLTLQNIELGSTRVRFAAYVNNVFDEIYPVFTTNANNYLLANPRTYGVDIAAEF